MSPKELMKEWQTVVVKDDHLNSPFRRIGHEELAHFQLPEVVRDFLFVGIPVETTTYNLDLWPPLRRVYEIFSPNFWTPSQKEFVQSYLVLGEDGGGNAVCLHESEGGIWLLDHEDFFSLVNSSTPASASFWSSHYSN